MKAPCKSIHSLPEANKKIVVKICDGRRQVSQLIPRLITPLQTYLVNKYVSCQDSILIMGYLYAIK